jgi:hypothetical protein
LAPQIQSFDVFPAAAGDQALPEKDLFMAI